MRRTILPAALVLLAAAPARAGDSNCDTSAIRWFLPHQFAEARAAAKERNRLLLVKGIAFGVDARGARCATAGSW